ncbi:MAG TPA: DUF2092 domain-containing protein [Burkholderiales bacterium]|nr:DUF2092 domain-containing protein [Burkholderiales bacterium]
MRPLLAAAALALATSLEAQAQPLPAAAPAAADQARAREILMRMAAYLAGAPRFGVSLRSGRDAVQKSGQKIERLEHRRIVLSRPDRLRVESERSDGVRTLSVFTGREIVVLDATRNVYASTPQPGGIDASVDRLVRDLDLRLPLAALLLERLPAELDAGLHMVRYVEKTGILGMPAHHLAARAGADDIQVWVADGERPLPLRVVVTYRRSPGQPQLRAQFEDWTLAPAIDDATFEPRMPDGVQKIPFAAQLARARPAAKGAKP